MFVDKGLKNVIHHKDWDCVESYRRNQHHKYVIEYIYMVKNKHQQIWD